jgi:hypothetical protein
MFTKYYYCDEIKEDKPGGTYIIHGGNKKCLQHFSYESLRKRPHGHIFVDGDYY